ncbi:MAG: hypothetical protein ACQKBT_06830, partial [Puniceicoccales bacterium]
MNQKFKYRSIFLGIDGPPRILGTIQPQNLIRSHSQLHADILCTRIEPLYRQEDSQGTLTSLQ